MELDAYLPRVVDGLLQRRLATSGAVLIEGPKACGKTATASRVAQSIVRLDVDPGARAAAGAAPEILFDQVPPVLFDEWQIEPSLWNLVRRAVDDRGPKRGQFILTGSATPNDDVARHSGAGRIATLRMRPMSLYESEHSTGQVSLAALFDGTAPRAVDPGLTVPALVDRIVVGGWPSLIGASPQDASEWVQDYLRQIVEVDVPSLGLKRDPRKLRRLVTSLGRHTGTSTAVTELAKDVRGPDAPSTSRDAIYRYLDVLDRLKIIDDCPAWAPHMRSKIPLRTSPTRYLVDPSLGVAALQVGSRKLLDDLNATGFHFEALVSRDLRVYSQPLSGEIHHWRDNSQHEVDLVVTLADGRWGAFEVKMNPRHADSAAASLQRFNEKVDTSKVGAPAFLGVITPTGPSFRRSDGVDVITIGALGP